MANKEMFKKLSMPKGPAKEPMFDMEDDAMASELEAPADAAEPAALEVPAEVAAAEDDILMQELEKRGYKVEKIAEEAAEDAAADDMAGLEGEAMDDEAL